MALLSIDTNFGGSHIMKFPGLLLTLAALVTACVTSAADSNSSYAPGVFEVSLIISDRGEAIFDGWDHPTGKSFNVDSIKVAPRSKFLSALVMFKNCKADSSGNCNAVVDIVAYDPSGKVYGKMPDVELWQQKPAPDLGFSQLSRTYMGIVIEPKDPIGTYRITAVAHDKNAKSVAKSQVEFKVGM